MRWLREWVLNNWWLKLLALGLSFALWTTYTAEPIVEVGYLVPLEFRNIPANLEISGDVLTQVHVRLRGRAALLRRLTPADVEVAMDLAGRPAGEARLHLTPDQVKAPLGARVVSVMPSQLRVPLVPRHAEPQSP